MKSCWEQAPASQFVNYGHSSDHAIWLLWGTPSIVYRSRILMATLRLTRENEVMMSVRDGATYNWVSLPTDNMGDAKKTVEVMLRMS
jgi:hypothetical protein